MPAATSEVFVPTGGISLPTTTLLGAGAVSPKFMWNKINVAAPTTFLLPPAASVPGQPILFTNVGPQVTITIQDPSGATINGQPSTQIARTNQSVELISDGTNWFIKGAAG